MSEWMTWGDLLFVVLIGIVIYVCVRLANRSRRG
jgi:hypothetical protein